MLQDNVNVFTDFETNRGKPRNVEFHEDVKRIQCMLDFPKPEFVPQLEEIFFEVIQTSKHRSEVLIAKKAFGWVAAFWQKYDKSGGDSLFSNKAEMDKFLSSSYEPPDGWMEAWKDFYSSYYYHDRKAKTVQLKLAELNAKVPKFPADGEEVELLFVNRDLAATTLTTIDGVPFRFKYFTEITKIQRNHDDGSIRIRYR